LMLRMDTLTRDNCNAERRLNRQAWGRDKP
jgi:hypothetical protein